MRLGSAAVAACALPLLAAAAVQDAGGSFELTDATSDQVAEAYWSKKPGLPQRAGQWTIAYRVTRAEMPGAPPSAERDAALAAIKGNPSTQSLCQGGEELSAPEPKKVFETLGGDCRYSRIAMGGGRFDAALRCTGPDGKPVAVATRGTYDPERFDFTMDVETSAPDQSAGKLAMALAVEGRRTGECAK